MTFDPLFHEVPMPAALRAELGIPEGAELWYLRFIGEVVRFPTVDVGPDGTPEPPRRRPRKAHLRAGYEIVYVYSLDAGTGTAPMWWGPGQLWLTRLRFGEDPVYGERRPPRPDDPHGEPRYSVTEEGNMAKASTAWRKFNSGLSGQRTSHVGPFERFGHGFVDILHKGEQARAERRHRGETGPFEQAPHADTEPDFHLIQPGRMRGGIHQAKAMRRIWPECGSGGHGLEAARWPFDAQLRVQPTLVRNEADEGFGLMRVQAIDHENPCRAWVTHHGTLNMAHNILCSPGRSHTRRPDLPGRDLKSGDQRLRARPKGCKFDAVPQAWRHRTCGMRAFIGLHAGLLIGTHEMHTWLGYVGGLLIQLAHGLDVWVTLLGVFDAVVIEPIA